MLGVVRCRHGAGPSVMRSCEYYLNLEDQNINGAAQLLCSPGFLLRFNADRQGAGGQYIQCQ